MPAFARISLLLAALLLAACGQKGALYIPEDAPPVEQEQTEPETDEDEEDGDHR